MPITLHTDFDAKYKLANVAPATQAGAPNPEGVDFAKFIADYEAEYLTDVLGYKMAKDFAAAMAIATPPTGVWAALYSGAEFTDKHGRLNKWPGFRNTVDLNPIAMYVYCKWQKERQSYSSGSGERVVLTENSQPITVRGKVVRAWNDMVAMNWILDDFLTQNIADYLDYKGVYGDMVSYGNLKYFQPINIFNI